jgi:hypothetical protein
VQTVGGAAKMQFFRNHQEISELSEFHRDSFD